MSDMHPSRVGFLAVLDEMRELHMRKGQDYGSVDDPFKNLRASEQFGLPAWVGAAIRANDKMVRIQSAVNQWTETGSFEMANESLEDAFIDLANYAAFGLVLLREYLDKGQYLGDKVLPEVEAQADSITEALDQAFSQALQGEDMRAYNGQQWSEVPRQVRPVQGYVYDDDGEEAHPINYEELRRAAARDREAELRQAKLDALVEEGRRLQDARNDCYQGFTPCEGDAHTVCPLCQEITCDEGCKNPCERRQEHWRDHFEYVY